MEQRETGNLDVLRQELERLYRKTAYTQIGNIEGIKIVKKRKEVPNLDCCSYALGIPWSKELMDEVVRINNLPEVEEREEGDYVLYLNSDGNPTHTGVLQKTGTVISKWGSSAHVYEHPIFLVPSSFGNKVRIVRDARKIL